MSVAATKAPIVTNKRADLRIGGKYTAIDNGDGTFDIKDVPVFGEVPAGAKRNKKDIGKDWQIAAVAKNKARAAEGYLPPVHIYHSDEIAVKPAHAGKLRLNEVRLITYQGKQIWATFGDLVAIPSNVFESKILPGFMPYRSVEVHDWDKEEIDSLALMDTDVPFFRLEMLTIGAVVKKGEGEYFRRQEGHTPAFAWKTSSEKAMAVFFKFGDEKPDKDEAPPADKKEGFPPGKEDAAPEEKLADAANCQKCGEEIPAGAPKCAKCGTPAPAPMKEGDPAAPPGAPGAAAPGQDLSAVMSMLQQMEAGIKAMTQSVMMLVNRIAPGGGAPLQEDPAPVSGLPNAEPELPKKEGAETMDAKEIEAIVLKAQAPLMQQVNALTTKLSEADKRQEIASRFSAAKQQLAGVALNAEGEAYLLKCAEHGGEILEGAIKAFKANMPVDPPKTGEEHEVTLLSSSDGEAGDAVAKFTAKYPGPKMLEWTKKQVALFAGYRKEFPGEAMTLEEWLETNKKAEAFA